MKFVQNVFDVNSMASLNRLFFMAYVSAFLSDYIQISINTYILNVLLSYIIAYFFKVYYIFLQHLDIIISIMDLGTLS